MDGIVLRVSCAVKRRLRKDMKGCRDAGLIRRYLIVMNRINGRSITETARVVGVATSTVKRVTARFKQAGLVGLMDRREDNGQTKLDEHCLGVLAQLVASNPDDHGWLRPTWTRELLVETMRKKTRVTMNVSTMSRALKMIGARRGRPLPIVRGTWSKAATTRRIRMIHGLIDTLPSDEVAVYQDEVDIHLNPKIGLDWMMRGQQKEVVTPGKNVKRYLAGAMDAVTGQLVWAESTRKNSDLFIALLRKLLEAYPAAKKIHVILDNCRIHSSRITQSALAAFEGHVVLHFLPPYSPEHNRIERLWQDLHAQVTRNHRCENMTVLMRRVRGFMQKRDNQAKRQLRIAA